MMVFNLKDDMQLLYKESFLSIQEIYKNLNFDGFKNNGIQKFENPVLTDMMSDFEMVE